MIQENKIKFELCPKNGVGLLFQSKLHIKWEDKIYEIKLNLLSNPSKGKSFTRVDNIKLLNTSNKEISKTDIKRNIYPFLTNVILKSDQAYQKFERKLNDYLLPPNFFEVDLTSPIILIPNSANLNEEQIEEILTNHKNQENIYKASFVKELENFIEGWEQKININSLEHEFQDFLWKNQKLFPSLFGIDNITNISKESVLAFEGEENKTDISNDYFIIELKRPITPLFMKKHSRKNIYGLTSDLISSVNQLNLYILKNDREKKWENFSFTKGILIIGSKKQFKDDIKDKTKSWILFKQNLKIDIYTFEDVLEKAKRLKNDLLN